MERMFILELTEKEVKLIQNNVIIGMNCEEQLKKAVKKGNKYCLNFTGDDLEELAGFVAAEANHAESESMEKKLDALSDKIEDLLKDTD